MRPLHKTWLPQRPLVLQAIHILALSFFFYPLRADTLLVSGIVSLFVYSLLLHKEYFRDRFSLSPFVLYLFLSWIRLGIVPVYLAVVVNLGYASDILFAGHDPSQHFIPGHFINLLGDAFFVSGYYLFRKFSSPLAPLQFRDLRTDPNLMLKSAVVLLVVTYGVWVGVLRNIPLQSIGQIYSFIVNYGAASAMLALLFSIRRVRPERKLQVVVILVAVFFVELSISFASYMKQSVIVCILPWFIYFSSSIQRRVGFRFTLNYRRLFAVGVVFVFSISVLFTYSELRRQAFWTRGGERTATGPLVVPYFLEAIKSSIPGTKEFGETQVFPRGGIWKVVDRNNLVAASAWCYSYVQHFGPSDGKFIKEVPINLIPRVLWPDKPQVARGRDLAVLLGQAHSWEDAKTSTGFSMAGCLYWAWGYPSLVIGMFLNGMAFFLAWKVFSPTMIINPISTLVCLSLFVNGVRWYEAAFDGNIVDYVFIFVGLLPLSLLLRKKRQRVVSATAVRGVKRGITHE